MCLKQWCYYSTNNNNTKPRTGVKTKICQAIWTKTNMGLRARKQAALGKEKTRLDLQEENLKMNKDLIHHEEGESKLRVRIRE